jgi:hypothetical protein
MTDRPKLSCKNALLVEVVHIRRATQKLIAAHGSGDLSSVIPSCLNINHSLNAIEARIGGCLSDGNLEATDKAA